MQEPNGQAYGVSPFDLSCILPKEPPSPFHSDIELVHAAPAPSPCTPFESETPSPTIPLAVEHVMPPHQQPTMKRVTVHDITGTEEFEGRSCRDIQRVFNTTFTLRKRLNGPVEPLQEPHCLRSGEEYTTKKEIDWIPPHEFPVLLSFFLLLTVKDSWHWITRNFSDKAKHTTYSVLDENWEMYRHKAIGNNVYIRVLLRSLGWIFRVSILVMVILVFTNTRWFTGPEIMSKRWKIEHQHHLNNRYGIDLTDHALLTDLAPYLTIVKVDIHIVSINVDRWDTATTAGYLRAVFPPGVQSRFDVFYSPLQADVPTMTQINNVTDELGRQQITWRFDMTYLTPLTRAQFPLDTLEAFMWLGASLSQRRNTWIVPNLEICPNGQQECTTSNVTQSELEIVETFWAVPTACVVDLLNGDHFQTNDDVAGFSLFTIVLKRGPQRQALFVFTAFPALIVLFITCISLVGTRGLLVLRIPERPGGRWWFIRGTTTLVFTLVTTQAFIRSQFPETLTLADGPFVAQYFTLTMAIVCLHFKLRVIPLHIITWFVFWLCVYLLVFDTETWDLWGHFPEAKLCAPLTVSEVEKMRG